MFRSIILLLLFSLPLSGEEVKNFGWSPPPVNQPDLSTDHKIRASDLPTYGDENDSLNYRFLYQILRDSGQLTQKELDTGRLSAIRQTIGDCVAQGTSNAIDINAATDILHRREPEEWKFRTSPQGNYGLIRYNNRGRYDGATGGWATSSIVKYGFLHRTVYGSYDLRRYDGKQGRQWAAQGLPPELLEAAGAHKVASCELITTLDGAKAAIQNGYCIIICAQASFEMTRDRDGFAKMTGREWAHCQCIVGVRGTKSGRVGWLVWNSWGDQAMRGGLYPADQPFCSYWITSEEFKRVLDQRDSWAIGNPEGFPKRKLSWKQVFTGEE